MSTSAHAVSTRGCNDIHIPKRSFYFNGAMDFNSLVIFIKSKQSFNESVEDAKDLFLNDIARF